MAKLTKLGTLSYSSEKKLKEIATKEGVYTDFLKFAGRVFKQDSSVALEFFAQNLTNGYIATEEQWSKAGAAVLLGAEAVNYVDESGRQSKLYELSQVDIQTPPRVWTINKESAVKIKSELGFSESESLVKSLITSEVTIPSLTENMQLLGLPPQCFQAYQKSFISAVQTVIAGRFEIGGGRVEAKPDMSIFGLLKDDNDRLKFLSQVSNAARTMLLRIEKIMTETEAKQYNEIKERQAENEQQENNNLPRMGYNDRETTARIVDEFGVGERNSAVDSDGTTAEQIGAVADVGEGRGGVVGSSAGEQPAGEIRGIQAEGSVGRDVVVQVQSVHRDIRAERGVGTVDGGRTNRDVRNGVARLHETSSPDGNIADVAPPQSVDGSEVSRHGGLATSRSLGEGLSDNVPSPALEGSRSRAEMGADNEFRGERNSDEGAGVSSTDDAVEKITNIMSEPSAEKVGGFSMPENAANTENSDTEELRLLTVQIADVQKKLSQNAALVATGNYRSTAMLAAELADIKQNETVK